MIVNGLLNSAHIIAVQKALNAANIDNFQLDLRPQIFGPYPFGPFRLPKFIEPRLWLNWL